MCGAQCFALFLCRSLDTREKEYKDAERWSDEKIFGQRAYFILDKEPAQLSVDNIQEEDENTYRCRVDFKFAQTRNSKVNLTVIGKFYSSYLHLPILSVFHHTSSSSLRKD